MNRDYLFESERLGFRNGTIEDLTEFAKINADVDEMEHFPKTLTKEETAAFRTRLINHYAEHNHNYFATEILKLEN